ncbi:MAG: cupin domain-containing protein [Ignavibacteriae bacterium]|nr:cupin domain-containing protein [Ignavibacteriota bacterium]
MKNIFDLPTHLTPQQETFEQLIGGENVIIERIVSTGQKTPEGQFYDQERDEWVLLLQGRATISYHDGTLHDLKSGDYLHIPAHTKHRVEATSTDQPCIWLAIHAHF